MNENAHWKKDERTQWKAMESTVPDTHSKIDPYEYSLVPPPPPMYSYRRPIPMAFYIICVVIVVIGITEIVGAYFMLQLKPLQKIIVQRVVITPFPTKVPTLTSVQTVNPNYTATDIFNDFRKAGLVRLGAVAQGPITVWSWSADNYFVATHATSSVSWSDDSGCTGFCSPAALGLWVYTTGIDAQQAAGQIGTDERTVGSIPMLGIPGIYVEGRCVFLSNDSQQTNQLYTHIIHDYCT